MTPKTLKIALAVSVALNLFAVGAGAAMLVARDRVEDRVEAAHRPPRQGSVFALIDQLEPTQRDAVKARLRAAAAEARPDFDEARAARREAIDLARAETMDAAQVAALLERSRTAELRGRAKLEAGAVAVLEGLDPQSRATLAPILSRRSGDRHRGRDRGGEDRARETRPAG